MKKTLKLFVILFALGMQASPVSADDNGIPLFLYNLKTGPKTNNNAGPRRAPARPTPLYMDIFLNIEERTLEMYDPEGNDITYYIYNENNEEKCSGSISFAGQEEVIVPLESLTTGIYYLKIVLDGTTYEGEFGLEE